MANNVDLEQMLHNATSYLGLHFLLRPARPILRVESLLDNTTRFPGETGENFFVFVKKKRIKKKYLIKRKNYKQNQQIDFWRKKKQQQQNSNISNKSTYWSLNALLGSQMSENH